MLQPCCGGGKECIVKDVEGLADPRMASCNVFYRLPDGSIWLLNKDKDDYLPIFVANDDVPQPDWNSNPEDPSGILNRPFKAIGWGLDKDDKGNIILDRLVLPNADWNVTDETNKDFIKNKPFQTLGDHLVVKDGQLNVCLENDTNLLPNSTWNLGEGTWAFTEGTGVNFEIQDPEQDKPNSHILHGKPVTSASQQISNMPHHIYVTADETYTIAFDYKENQVPSSTNRFVFALRVFPEKDTLNSQANALWFENIYHSFLEETVPAPITDFHRFVYEFTPKFSGWLDVIPYDSDTSGTHESWWRELMVIHGGACEMPEDWHAYAGDNAGEDVILYPTTGQNEDGAMTQKAVTDELAKKANVTDLSGYVTLDTTQTITGIKVFEKQLEVRSVPHATDTQTAGALNIRQITSTGTRGQVQSLVRTNPQMPKETGNGFTIGISAGANTILAGGEAHVALLKAIQTPETTPPVLSKVKGGTEHAIVVADNDVYIGTAYQNGSTDPTGGYWWRFAKEDGKLYSPTGAEILDKTYGDKLYVSLTEVNHVLGETTFDNVKASSDTDGWVIIKDRRNGFSGGTIQYKRHMNVVTIQGDGIIPPVMAKYEHKVICVLPDGARITKGKPTGSGMVSNVAMGYHCESNGELSLHAGDDLTTAMRASFTFTYVV